MIFTFSELDIRAHRALFVVVVLTACVAAASCREQPDVIVNAPPQLAGGTAILDGTVRVELRHEVYYKWVGWRNMSKELNAPPCNDAIARFHKLLPGPHIVKLETPAYETIVVRFIYSGTPLEVKIPDELLRSTRKSV